jgi:hypothetical protein
MLGLDVASYHAIGGFTVYDPELGWKLAPSRDAVFKGAHFSVAVSQNAEGLRGPHYPDTRTPGRRRILVLGDSFVWCWGVEQADCFTQQIESALGDTDVVNAGVPGYSTAQEVLLYEREVRRYRPDLVLLVFVPNDPFENVSGLGPRFTLDAGHLVERNAIVPRRKGPVREWLQEHSRLFAQAHYLVTVVVQTVRYRLAGRAFRGKTLAPSAPASAPAPEQTYVPASSGIGPGRAVTEALLDRIRTDVQADGARFALVFEAMPKPMTAWMQEFCAARDLPCLFLGPALWAAEQRGEKVRLIGDPHVAAAGQKVITGEVLAFVRDKALLPTRE